MNRESLKQHCEAMCERFKDVPTSGAYSEHRLVLDLLEQTEWIPVSEMLPTEEEYIANNGLFIVSDGNRTYTEYFDVYNSMKYFGEPTMNGFRVDRCVIAWMTLPKPYEVESEEKPSWLGKNCKDCGNEKCKKLGTLPKGYDCALWQAKVENCSIKTVTNAKDAENYPISEDLSELKGENNADG